MQSPQQHVSFTDIPHHPGLHAFVQQFPNHHPYPDPSATLDDVIQQANTHTAAMSPSQTFFGIPSQHLYGFQQQPFNIPRQHVFSTIHISAKLGMKKIISIFTRFGSNLKEVTIGSASCFVTFNTNPKDDSCYIEYVPARQRWRVASRPSDIPLRIVDESELSHRCQQLSTIGGCVFKTPTTTLTQESKPLELPARSLRSMMLSLGFCVADTGAIYHVFAPRVGRHIKATVIVVAHVDQYGENLNNGLGIEGTALVADVAVVPGGSAPDVVHWLRTRSRNSLMTIRGLGMVRKKLVGHNSIVFI